MGEARTMVERLYERIDRNDLESALQLFTPDAEFTFPGVQVRGREQIATFMTGMWEAFPSHRHDIVTAVEGADRIAVEGIATAVHSGPLMSPGGVVPATGRDVVLPICHVLVLEAGLIASSHIWYDQLDMLSQLGLVPAAA